MSEITIRQARASDAKALAKLAELDSQLPLAGQAILAENESGTVAALDISSGRVIADPFRRTSDVVEILRVSARGSRERRHGAQRLIARAA